MVKPRVARICGGSPLRNYFIFTKNILFIWGLVLADIIVEYATVSTMMIYLVNVIGQHLLIAAITINVFDGLSAILVFIFAYSSYAYTARFNAIVFSTGAYIMGLFLLWITAYSSKEFSICNVALSLIAVGKSGRCSALRSYFECQLRKESECTENAGKHQTPQNLREQQREIGITMWWYSAWVSGCIIAVFAIGGTTPHESFKISALFTLAMFVIFYSGICCYYQDNPDRESLGLGIVFKALKATSRKLYLWATFIPYGLVLATGYTLFIAQIANMNILIGSNFTVPVSFFFVLKSFVSNIVVFLFWWGGTVRKGITVIRIGAGIMCAVLCCVVAWRVELQRLDIIKKEALIQDPTIMSSMSVLWLVPQYTLLGLMEGLAGDGLVTHICGHVPELVRRFAEPFSELMWCTGKFCSIFCVLFCNLWFGQSINISHLDSYFLVIAILCFLFFCFYLFWWWNYENPEINEDLQRLQLVCGQVSQGTCKPIGNPLLDEEGDDELEMANNLVEIVRTEVEEAKDIDKKKGEDQNTPAEGRG